MTGSRSWTDDEVKQSTLDHVHTQALWFPRIQEAAKQYATTLAAGDASAWHERRLAALLDHAVASVPAYRALGQEVRVAASPAQALACFPVVDREILVEQLVAHCSEPLDPTSANIAYTSGTSTGSPLKFVVNHEHLIETYGAAYARREQLGIELHSRTLRPCQEILQSWYEYTEPAHGFAHVAAFGLRNLSPDDRCELARRSARFAPQTLAALPSQLLEFAGLLEESGVRLPQVRLIQTYGEFLDPRVRRRLEGYFSAAVVDAYGLREVSTVAAQCTAGSHHVEVPRVRVEVVGPDDSPQPPGTSGEIVVTELVNRAMPFIRYRTGDVGSVTTQECPCGLDWPMLLIADARKDSGTLRLANGHMVALVNVVAVLRRFAVERFQVVQRTPRSSELRVWLMPDADAGELARIQRDLKQELGSPADTGIELVHTRDFLVGPGGKHRELVNES